MLFILNVCNELGEIQEFSIVLEKLEDGLDLLNNLALLGHTLLKVNVFDQDSNTSLPVELFDGTLFTIPLQRLEAQWQAILARPLKSPAASTKRVANLFQQKRERYEQEIHKLDLRIMNLQAHLKKICDSRISPALKPALIQHFQLMVATCEQHHVRLHSLRKQSIEILSQIR